MWLHPHHQLLATVLMLACGFGQIGCNSAPRTPPRAPVEQTVRVTQHVGGTHYRVLLHGNVMYQTFGPELLVVEPRSNRVIRQIELGTIGRNGSAIDMLIHQDRLFVVLERDEVVELTLADPEQPRILTRESASALGIEPQRLSIANDALYVSGIGGVVRWDDGRLFRPNDGEFSRVALSNEGLVACTGRRIHRLNDGRYVGSASDVMHADGIERAPDGVLAFVRQHEQGALVGLMTADLREINVAATTIAVPGQVHAVRIFDDALWIVNDDEILCYRLLDDHLRKVKTIDVLGARDVVRLDENHLAVVGSFGRAIYRERSTSRGPGDTFIYAHREPCRLIRAQSDGRHILAGGPEGAWLYLIGSRVQMAAMPEGDPTAPPRTATTVDAVATIDDDNMRLIITVGDRTFTHSEPDGSALHTVVAVEGEFWVGHDRGITVLALPPAEAEASSTAAVPAQPPGVRTAGRVRLDGPVRYLFSLRADRGVSYVAEWGGFGIARYAADDSSALP